MRNSPFLYNKCILILVKRVFAMKKQLENKISQFFYKPTKNLGDSRISTSLDKFDKEIGKAIDDVFRTEKKKK